MDLEIKENVTENLIKLALKSDKGQDANFLSFEVLPLDNKGENFASVLTSVMVTYAKSGSEHNENYVVKVNDERLKFYSVAFDEMFAREIDVLSTVIVGMNKVLGKLNLPPIKTPKIYASSLNKGKEVLILQNLRTEGFTLLNIREGMDMNHSRLALKEIGRFHATSLLYEEQCDEAIPKYLKVPIFEHSPGISEIFEDLLKERSKTLISFLEKYESKYEKLLKWIGGDVHKVGKNFHKTHSPFKSFNMFVHGDCSTHNMLFKYNEDNIPVDIRFVDFQFFSKASPTTDLNFFFYVSLDKDLRLKERDNMIAIYYESFQEVLKMGGKIPPFSYQELVQEIMDRRILALTYLLLVFPSIIEKDEKASMNSDYKPENKDQLIDVCKFSEELLEKGGPLVDRLMSAIEEFINEDVFD